MDLGKIAYVGLFAVKGFLDESRCAAVLEEIIQVSGMRRDGLHAACWKYPAWGAGGAGITYVQPLFQSLSFADTWTEHGGGYLGLFSCARWDAPAIFEAIESQGLEVVDVFYATLSLDVETQNTRGRIEPPWQQQENTGRDMP